MTETARCWNHELISRALRVLAVLFIVPLLAVSSQMALAGGFTYRASEDSVLLKREGTTAEVSVAVDTPVLPGDVLTVEERFF